MAQSHRSRHLTLDLSVLGLLDMEDFSPRYLATLDRPNLSPQNTPRDHAYDADIEPISDSDLSPSNTLPHLAFPPTLYDDGKASSPTPSFASPNRVRNLQIESDGDASQSRVESSGVDSSWTIDRAWESDRTVEDSNYARPQATEEETETEEIFRQDLTDFLHQMMFVSGETAEPSIETTTLIEEITRQQVIEIVRISFLPPATWLLTETAAHAQHRFGYSSGLTIHLH